MGYEEATVAHYTKQFTYGFETRRLTTQRWKQDADDTWSVSSET